MKIPKSESPDFWIRVPRHKWPKSWSSMEDPVVPLERNLYGNPLAGLLWERQFKKIQKKNGWEKVSNWKCLFVHREKGLFLSVCVCVDDINKAGKKQNIDPMWKVLNKEVDLGKPTSFLDHVHLGCTQRQCEISKDIVDNYRTHQSLACKVYVFSDSVLCLGKVKSEPSIKYCLGRTIELVQRFTTIQNFGHN